MKTFIADIFPKLQRFSKKLDDLTLLTNQHWVLIDNILNNKTVYIFRSNNELLISTNGNVEKAKWEHLGNKSLLIDKLNNSYLFKHEFYDEDFLALKLDSREEYAVFVNENNYDGKNINSLDKVNHFLEQKYFKALDEEQIKNEGTIHLEMKTEKPILNVIPENMDDSGEKSEGEKFEASFYKFSVAITIIIFIILYILSKAK